MNFSSALPESGLKSVWDKVGATKTVHTVKEVVGDIALSEACFVFV